MIELADEEGDSIDDGSLSGRAHWLLRRMMGAGWIELDPTAHTVEDLRRFPTAITPSCMLYRAFVARQLHPDRYAVPYIGQKAIEDQIRIKQQELGRAVRARRRRGTGCLPVCRG